MMSWAGPVQINVCAARQFCRDQWSDAYEVEETESDVSHVGDAPGRACPLLGEHTVRDLFREHAAAPRGVVSFLRRAVRSLAEGCGSFESLARRSAEVASACRRLEDDFRIRLCWVTPDDPVGGGCFRRGFEVGTVIKYTMTQCVVEGKHQPEVSRAVQDLFPGYRNARSFSSGDVRELSQCQQAAWSLVSGLVVIMVMGHFAGEQEVLCTGYRLLSSWERDVKLCFVDAPPCSSSCLPPSYVESLGGGPSEHL